MGISVRMDSDTRDRIDRISAWEKITDRIGRFFVAVLVASIAVAAIEYYTMEPLWSGVATLLFNVVSFIPIVLVFTLRLELRKKDLILRSLRETTDTTKRTKHE